jgi:hypothetical protein
MVSYRRVMQDIVDQSTLHEYDLPDERVVAALVLVGCGTGDCWNARSNV